MKKHLVLSAAALAMLTGALVVQAPLLAQDRMPPVLGFEAGDMPGFRVLDDARRPEVLGQVRIEQRVIIRISPSPPDAGQRLQALQPRRSGGAYREVGHDDCVRVENIVGAQPTGDNRLLLFMENRNVLAATLERGCSAEAFYSGFYVERSRDGRLCVSRDRLQSRAGVSCSVADLTRLVAGD